MTDISPLFPTMNTDVALADLSSCRAVRIVAKLSLWVHWCTSLSDRLNQTKDASGLTFWQIGPHHGLVGSYLIITYNKKGFQGVEHFGIGLLTPKEFLQKIGEVS
ncbi:hypothetical protein D6833_01570 [Candidatus Parcubacteria bacterium]|nr:MAG: hypothetical protein D6833_01570 [Candidatus Parcubacteria bacterium]